MDMTPFWLDGSRFWSERIKQKHSFGIKTEKICLFDLKNNNIVQSFVKKIYRTKKEE